ncbi:MAG: hypothetical protein ACXWQO_09370 [Bdellovibrionota bacterium]
MKTPTKIKNAIFALAAIATLATSSAFAVEGGTEGNGGDAVRRDGQLVLRDFIKSARLSLVQKNRDFLSQQSEFVALLKDMAAGDPYLALQVWNDLLNVKIWLTEKDLPLLPDAATSVISDKAEVQIAIRNGDDVILSMPNFRNLPADERGYVFVHESLHKLLKDQSADQRGDKEDGKAWHHEEVRWFVGYLRDNRGHYDAKDLNGYLDKFSISHTDVATKTGKLMRDLVRENGDFAQRCVVEKKLEGESDFDDYFLAIVRNEWANYNKCGYSVSAKGELLKLYPAMKSVYDFAESGLAIQGSFYPLDVSHGNYRYHKYGQTLGGIIPIDYPYFDSAAYAQDCKKYADPRYAPGFKKGLSAGRAAMAALKQLMGETASLGKDNDLAKSTVVGSALAAVSEDVKSNLQDIEKSAKVYQASVTDCRANLGDYMNR